MNWVLLVTHLPGYTLRLPKPGPYSERFPFRPAYIYQYGLLYYAALLESVMWKERSQITGIKELLNLYIPG